MKLSLKSALPTAMIVGLAFALPASAGAAGDHSPVANVAGGDVPPALPALVDQPVQRTQRMLIRASYQSDAGHADLAAQSLQSARNSLRAAWRRTEYLIDNAPPPVQDGSAYSRTALRSWCAARAKKRGGSAKKRARRRKRCIARFSGTGAPVGTTADLPTTAFAVLTLQHTAATTAVGMIQVSEPLLTEVSRTLFVALNQRDLAVDKIHQAEPPVAEEGSVHAEASDGPPTFATYMPGVSAQIDDELQQIDGMRPEVAQKPGRTRVLNAADSQDHATQATVNQYWPPVVGD